MEKILKQVRDRGWVRGEVEIIITKKDGTVIIDKDHNLVVDAGIAQTAKRIFTDTVAPSTYLAIGSGTTAPADGNIALESEFASGGLERKTGTPTSVTTTIANDSVLFDATWYPTVAATVTEVGIFNDASTGTMTGRRVFTGRYVENGDNIRIKYKLILS